MRQQPVGESIVGQGTRSEAEDPFSKIELMVSRLTKSNSLPVTGRNFSPSISSCMNRTKQFKFL